MNDPGFAWGSHPMWTWIGHTVCLYHRLDLQIIFINSKFYNIVGWVKFSSF